MEQNTIILYVQTCIELGDKRLHSISNRDYWCHQPCGFQHQFTTAVDRGTHEIELASDPGETKPVEITEPTRPSYRIHCLLTVSSSFPLRLSLLRSLLQISDLSYCHSTQLAQQRHMHKPKTTIIRTTVTISGVASGHRGASACNKQWLKRTQHNC